MVLLWLNEVFVYSLSGHWDWLFISGVVIAFLGLRLGILLPAQMGRMLGRLRVSGSLVLMNGAEQVLSEEQLKTFRGSFEARSARWARNGGIGGIVVILFSILAMSYYRKDLSNIIGNFGGIITNPLYTIFFVAFVIFLEMEICVVYVM